MRIQVENYVISDDKALLDIGMIKTFLSRSYWAHTRSDDQIERSIEYSICYGVYDGKRQIGFARVVTDEATMYWLADVFIDEAYRNHGIGKQFVSAIVHSDRLKGLMGILGTKDAHGLYEKFGFVRDTERMMRRRPQDISCSFLGEATDVQRK